MNPDRYDLALLVAGMPFQGDTLETKSLGGSETAGLCMARELAKIGHHVTVFANCEKPGEYDGVTYRPIMANGQNQWSAFSMMNPHDIAIAQRLPEVFAPRLNARLNLLWCHDLALRRDRDKMGGVAWNIDKIMVLSQFMKAQYQEVHGLPDQVFWVTRNGIELDRIRRVREQLAHEGWPEPERGDMATAPWSHQRDRKKLMYTARPERGLDALLDVIFPALLQREPDVRLYLAGYDNTVAEMLPFYQEINAKISRFGDKVVWLGHLRKDELYAHYLTAGLYVYPTPSPINPDFEEISSISAMEAQACGLPVVSTKKGALPETLAARAGILIDGDPWDREAKRWSERYAQEFVDACLRLLTDEDEWQKCSEAGILRAQSLDWADVAVEWTEEFGKLLAERNSSPARLVRHFIRRSDIIAAKALTGQFLDGQSFGDGPPVVDPQVREMLELHEKLKQDWGFADHPDGMREQAETNGVEQQAIHAASGDPSATAILEADRASRQETLEGGDRFREQYERIGKTHTDVFEQAAQEPRFLNVLLPWLQQHPEAERILDFGCAHGAYAVNAANAVGRRWVGVDIDKHSIDWANRFRTERAQDAGALAFRVGDEAVDLSDQEPFDLLWIGETLEHLPEPWRIEQLERWLKPGGKVLMTVPFGPWEYMSYDEYPWRAHLWEYDRHDLRDLFGKKAGLRILAMPMGFAKYMNEPIGWHVIEYTVQPNRPCGRIDLARKLRIQRPRQTVSANIMAGAGAEQTFDWCLRSLKHVADEVVVVDTGMTEEGRAIAQRYKATIVPGPDPKVEGFEAPRNVGLGYCRMDWVLWIDTDEKLELAEHLHKYLRDNLFNGYGIRQHHFAVDVLVKPDLPIRVFRRKPYQGKTMRWYGMIHEHPELGLNEGPGPTITLGDVHIPHLGYFTEAGRRERFSRNYPMLQKDMEKYPTRLLQQHFRMRDNMLLVMYEAQQTGQISAEGRKRCEETIALWREHFRAKGGYIGVDSLQYYSQACQALGLGADVIVTGVSDGPGMQPVFTVVAGRNGAMPPVVPVTYRFATAEDLEEELKWRAKAALAPYTGRWY